MDANRLRGNSEEAQKPCSDCKLVLSLDKFCRSKHAADGRHNMCKSCTANRLRARDKRLDEVRDEVRRRGCIICGMKNPTETALINFDDQRVLR